jgi:Xaa-Pro aminopeptidase
LTTVAHTFVDRRRRLAEALTGARLEALAVAHLPNVRYLTGFTGSNAVLLLDGRRSTLYTDPRYTLQARQECDIPVRIIAQGPLWTGVTREIQRRSWKHVGLEASHVSQQQWQSVAQALGRAVRLKDASGLVEKLRMVKDAGEIAAIRASVQLAAKAFHKAIRKVRAGQTELALAAEIDHQMRLLGAEGPAFETIVAAGERSALPHARPTARPIAPNQILLVDMGASLNGYMSDMTRVVHAGPPSVEARPLYDAVLEAQLAAIAAVAPGMTVGGVDAAARGALRKRRLDRLFTHSTGHGLGLEIHEGPRLGRLAQERLEPGMVVTIEPGAYQEGFGGVRIEDTVLVTPTGVEVLTPTSKEFLEIPL